MSLLSGREVHFFAHLLQNYLGSFINISELIYFIRLIPGYLQFFFCSITNGISNFPQLSWRGINWEIGMYISTVIYIKKITNKDLLYSTVNFTQYSMMTYMGKDSNTEWIYVCV